MSAAYSFKAEASSAASGVLAETGSTWAVTASEISLTRRRTNEAARPMSSANAAHVVGPISSIVARLAIFMARLGERSG